MAVIRTRAFITSPNRVGILTTEGCIASRTKPNCVSGQAAHPVVQFAANHRCAARWICVGQAKASRTFTSSRHTDTLTVPAQEIPVPRLDLLCVWLKQHRLARNPAFPPAHGRPENRFGCSTACGQRHPAAQVRTKLFRPKPREHGPEPWLHPEQHFL